MTVRVSFRLNKGEDKTIIVGRDLPFSVYGIDLLGYTTARMQVRPKADSDEVVDLLSTDNGRLKFDGSSLVMKFTHEATSRVKHRRCVYDLEVTSPNGDIFRLLEGSIVYVPEVTR